MLCGLRIFLGHLLENVLAKNGEHNLCLIILNIPIKHHQTLSFCHLKMVNVINLNALAESINSAWFPYCWLTYATGHMIHATLHFSFFKS